MREEDTTARCITLCMAGPIVTIGTGTTIHLYYYVYLSMSIKNTILYEFISPRSISLILASSLFNGIITVDLLEIIDMFIA